MSYILQNGRRYYKDDRTGRVTVDNVSQAEADRRERQNQYRSGLQASGYNDVVGRRINPGAALETPGISRKLIVILLVIVVFAAAFLYNHYHESDSETAINNYMTAEGNSEEVSENSDNIDEEQGEYLMADSAKRYLSVSDIEGYSGAEKQLLINEIYARHGRKFHSQENIDYFSSQDWYNPVPGKTDEEIVREFNEYERANVDLLSESL